MSDIGSGPGRRQGGALLLKLVLTVLMVVALAAATLYSKREHIVLGAEAYVFGYPLVIMDVTRANGAATLGPGNMLHRMRKFPDADFKEIVRANVDTLYTNAFIDMAQGPWVFEMPANESRYVLMPFMDAWTNVFVSPGWRTDGKGGGKFLMVGPGWQGETPAGLKLVRSPTNMVWLLGRIQTNGEGDYATVHALQDALQFRSLADWQAGRVAEPSPAQPLGEKPLPPIVQMKQMSAEAFFARLTGLLVSNPPAPADGPLMEKFARIGLAPGQPPQWTALESWCVALGRRLADWKIEQELTKPRELVNGWSTPSKELGDYGTSYGLRTIVAMVGLGANLPADAVYPSAGKDGTGQTLDGTHRYVLHFDAGKLPPVNAFWSVTAYGDDSFFITNSLKRYALGDRDPLKFNPDGSLDIYVQADAPEAAIQSNWLPIAKSPFNLTARLYWPKQAVLDGQWVMPPIRRVD